ncbi:aldehyde dehydrogenase (NADP(+)) [Streptomyces acidicola]|uniref:Aldehyde dehydrogenase (NADP(+)) n=1 Tax=Streptomyces acidicola TaxID=2596892 RepID=A0A5N8WN61_9ACTN|nr:aldehyde dehydrogenase (NADP(+)) [Streptomyces acidicola]MPY48883.1 aldehyde dehydrogenase (NADP(+)) [Streptomyces acidicola]
MDLTESSPAQRTGLLNAIADELTAAADELVPQAMAETGLAEARLRGELKRTVVQLRLFADVCAEGEFLDVRIDEADPGFVLGPRPDLRRFNLPVGPVLVFAASNFPFAFSVAGGDTASALAAGCPVILKAHPGHPRLSALTAEKVRGALLRAGLPAETFEVVFDQEDGVRLLRDDRIAAAAFTGSFEIGRMLAGIAAGRERPIPFYGELGSVNPVVVTPAALAERADEVASGFVAGVSGSAGQLCTKPGFLFLPDGHGLARTLGSAADAVPGHPLLHEGIAAAYTERRAAVLAAPGVAVLAEGAVEAAPDGWCRATPTLVEVGLDDLLKQRSALLDEAFGPLSIVVRYDPDRPDLLMDAIGRLFPGALTATVHSAAGENNEWLRRLVALLRERVGRLLFNGWPTGVAVTPAMQHGGPYPATTAPATTSVGTAAIQRFLRPVTFQNCPPELLPPALRDDNPWRVPQRRSAAGASVNWGNPVS